MTKLLLRRWIPINLLLMNQTEEKNNININDISRWGLYRQIKIEQKIDSYLKKINPPSDKELNKIIQEWCKLKNIKSSEILQEWKIANGLTEELWIDYVTRKWRWSKWCLEKFKNKIPNYYLERKSMLDNVKYSLIRLRNQNLASELYLRIKEGESSFDDVAQQYSEGPERETHGRIGPVPFGTTHPQLAELLQSSISGQIWPPKMIESWWVIVKLDHIENIPLDEKLTIDLGLELGLKYVEQEFNRELKKLAFNKT